MKYQPALKFRKEKFGGIVFNPLNACEIQVNKKLFSALLNKTTSKETKEVYSKLNINNPLLIKNDFFNIKEFNHRFNFKILNSPILADINITNKCNLHCPHCYIESKEDGKHMSFNDFELVLDNCQKAGILQIALGGGEPTLHPQFSKILKAIHNKNIIPNLTSNGKNLSWLTVLSIAKYCGAMALSIEDIYSNFEIIRNFSYREFQKSVKKIKAAKINLVFQITLGGNNIDNIENILCELLKYQPYGILFLAYKPQGRGRKLNFELSRINQKKVNEKIHSIFKILKNKTKIGFDCCSTPALINSLKSKSFIGCSASRSSLAIMPNLDVLPCSFIDKDIKRDNLKNRNLVEIWQGENFNIFREKILKKINSPYCEGCLSSDICLGGCPIFNLANCK